MTAELRACPRDQGRERIAGEPSAEAERACVEARGGKPVDVVSTLTGGEGAAAGGSTAVDDADEGGVAGGGSAGRTGLAAGAGLAGVSGGFAGTGEVAGGVGVAGVAVSTM
nr:glycine-rich protein 5-like [Setaria viridis]